MPIQRNLADEEQKVKILDDQELRLIFGNVEEILHGSKVLHQALDHAWKEALAAKRAPHVGQIFLDHVSAVFVSCACRAVVCGACGVVWVCGGAYADVG